MKYYKYSDRGHQFIKGLAIFFSNSVPWTFCNLCHVCGLLPFSIIFPLSKKKQVLKKIFPNSTNLDKLLSRFIVLDPDYSIYRVQENVRTKIYVRLYQENKEQGFILVQVLTENSNTILVYMYIRMGIPHRLQGRSKVANLIRPLEAIENGPDEIYSVIRMLAFSSLYLDVTLACNSILVHLRWGCCIYGDYQLLLQVELEELGQNTG